MSVLSGSKLLDTLLVFQKQFLEKVNFEKCQQMTTKAYQKLTFIYFRTLCVITFVITHVLKISTVRSCGLKFYMNYLLADNSNEIFSFILSLNEIFSPKVAFIVCIVQLLPYKKQHFFERV